MRILLSCVMLLGLLNLTIADDEQRYWQFMCEYNGTKIDNEDADLVLGTIFLWPQDTTDIIYAVDYNESAPIGFTEGVGEVKKQGPPVFGGAAYGFISGKLASERHPITGGQGTRLYFTDTTPHPDVTDLELSYYYPDPTDASFANITATAIEWSGSLHVDFRYEAFNTTVDAADCHVVITQYNGVVPIATEELVHQDTSQGKVAFQGRHLGDVAIHENATKIILFVMVIKDVGGGIVTANSKVVWEKNH